MNGCIHYWYKIWTKLTQNPKLYTNKNLCHLGSYLKILEHPHNGLKLIVLAKAFREDEPVVVTTAEQKWGYWRTCYSILGRWVMPGLSR